jgi:leucyl-tRNA synthetase
MQVRSHSPWLPAVADWENTFGRGRERALCQKESDLEEQVNSLHGPLDWSLPEVETAVVHLTYKLFKHYHAAPEFVNQHLLVELCKHFFPH